jgi:hypothetical protein
MHLPRSLKIITVICFASLVGFSAPAEAGGKKNRAGAGRVLGRFDRNQDSKIDGTEADRLRTLYSTLAALDTDHDGQLSDSEISAAKVVASKRQRKSKSQK